MRCPDCGKFVGMETGEPEITSDPEANLSGGEITVTVSAEVPRNCAECGTELKRGTYDNMETAIDRDEIVEAAPEAIRAEVRDLLDADDDGLTVEATEESSEAEEGGGGRYAKNMIVCTVNAVVEVSRTDGEKFADGSELFAIPVALTDELAAGDFEEQV